MKKKTPPLEPGKDLVLIVEDCRPDVLAEDRVKFRLARYEGRFVYPSNTPANSATNGNPRFRLPDGQEIWGCECYWAAFHPKGAVCGFTGNGEPPCVLIHGHLAPHRPYG